MNGARITDFDVAFFKSALVVDTSNYSANGSVCVGAPISNSS